jgi:hypothetical protein
MLMDMCMFMYSSSGICSGCGTGSGMGGVRNF